MILLENISDQSELIDDQLKGQLSNVFEKMEDEVVMKAVVNLENEKDNELACFLKVCASLSDKLKLELYTPDEADQVSELDLTYLPATGLYKNNEYARVAFHGVPGGKEINSFVLSIYNLAGPGQEMEKSIRKKIDKLNKKTNIKICVSLGCSYCPRVVHACQRIAILNKNIEAEMIDAALYQDLIDKYDIKRVPMMIFNDKDIYMGNKEMEEIINLIRY